MKKHLYPKVEDVAEIPVFPNFCYFFRKFNFTCNAPVCEDDFGNIAFLSQEEKERFLRGEYRRRGEGQS